MNLRKKYLYTLAGTGMALGLSGCVPLGEPTLGDTPATESAATEESQVPDGIGEFGQVVSWDGVDMVISKPKTFEPSQYAAGADEFPDTVILNVKLTNTGDDPFDPTLVYLTASSAEQEASMVFDAEQKIEAPPTTSVLPGKSVKWSVVLNVADADDLLVEVSPDFALEPVLFSTGG
jgi:hypothetical protein